MEGKTTECGRASTPLHLAVCCDNGMVRLFDKEHQEVSLFDGFSFSGYEISIGENQQLFLNDWEKKEVQVSDSDGRLTNSFHCDGKARSVHYDPFGERLVVALGDRNMVQFLDPVSGQPLAYLDCLQGPRFAFVDRKNRCIISSLWNLQVLAEDGKELFRSGAVGSGHGQFNFVSGLAIDRNNRILVSDAHNKRVNVFSEKCELEKTFELNFEPWGMAVDPDNGNIYLSDNGRDRIVVMDEATGEELSSFDVPQPCGLSTTPIKRWRKWTPGQSSSPVVSVVKAWCASDQQGPLRLLPPDLVFHELSQFVFNAASLSK